MVLGLWCDFVGILAITCVIVGPLYAVEDVVSSWLLFDDPEQFSFRVGDMCMHRRDITNEYLAPAGVAVAH